MSRELRIGPMRPDEVASTSKGLTRDSMDMIQAVHASFPPELRAALQRTQDPAGTKALSLDALSAEYGVTVLGAAVYGLPGDKQSICYIYEDESGRVGRWYQDVKDSPYQEQIETAVWEPEVPEPFEPEPVSVQAPQRSRRQAPTPAPVPEPEPEPELDDASEEPWEGYDTETVAEIQARLDDLDSDTLEDVSVYERAHKARKGVLEPVDELLAG